MWQVYLLIGMFVVVGILAIAACWLILSIFGEMCSQNYRSRHAYKDEEE